AALARYTPAGTEAVALRLRPFLAQSAQHFARSKLPRALAEDRDGRAVGRDPVDLHVVSSDHEVGVDPALVHLRGVLVVEHEGVAVADRDVAGRVLVDQRRAEDRPEPADPAFAIDERDLAESCRSVVDPEVGARRLGSDVRVDLDRASVLE